MQVQPNQQSHPSKRELANSARDPSFGFIQTPTAVSFDLFADVFRSFAEPIQSAAPTSKPLVTPTSSTDDVDDAIAESNEASSLKDEDKPDTSVEPPPQLVALLPSVDNREKVSEPNEGTAEQRVLTGDSLDKDTTDVSDQAGPRAAALPSEPNSVVAAPVEENDPLAAQSTHLESTDELKSETSQDSRQRFAKDCRSKEDVNNAPTAPVAVSGSHSPQNDNPIVTSDESNDQSPAPVPTEALAASQNAQELPSRDRRDRRGRDKDNSNSAVNEVRSDSGNAAENQYSEQPITGASSSSESLGVNTSFSTSPAIEAIAPSPVGASAFATAAVQAAATSSQTIGNNSEGVQRTASPTSIGSIVPGGPRSTGTPATPSDSSAVDSNRQSEIADRARLVHRISKAFQRIGLDGGQVRLRMHPEELGGIQLEMRINGRVVQATVTADTEQASAILREHLPELRQRLESQGLTIERLDVGTRNESGTQSSSQQAFQQGSRQGNDPRQNDGVWQRRVEPAVSAATAPKVQSPRPLQLGRSSHSLDLQL